MNIAQCDFNGILTKREGYLFIYTVNITVNMQIIQYHGIAFQYHHEVTCTSPWCCNTGSCVRKLIFPGQLFLLIGEVLKTLWFIANGGETVIVKIISLQYSVKPQ